MLDTDVNSALLTLLRIGLWGKSENLTNFPLSESLWLDIYNASSQHTIEGIVFDAIQHLPKEFHPPKAILLKWIVKVDLVERHNIHVAKVTNELITFFNKNNLFPTLLKGQALASCYINPLRRLSGDIDLYFHSKNEYNQATELLRERNVQVVDTPGFSNNYIWRGVVIEHHQRMFDIHNPLCYSYLDKLQKKPVSQEIYKNLPNNLALPAPIVMQVQVNAHILKHLLSFGIGLRQLCDSARFAYKYHQYIDGQEMKTIYKNLGILKWVELLNDILVRHLGLPSNYLPFENEKNINADWMMEDILVTGNFGFHDTKNITENENKEIMRTNVKHTIWSNAKRYFKYAPMEVITFPFVQAYSKLIIK